MIRDISGRAGNDDYWIFDAIIEMLKDLSIPNSGDVARKILEANDISDVHWILYDLKINETNVIINDIARELKANFFSLFEEMKIPEDVFLELISATLNKNRDLRLFYSYRQDKTQDFLYKLSYTFTSLFNILHKLPIPEDMYETFVSDMIRRCKNKEIVCYKDVVSNLKLEELHKKLSIVTKKIMEVLKNRKSQPQIQPLIPSNVISKDKLNQLVGKGLKITGSDLISNYNVNKDTGQQNIDASIIFEYSGAVFPIDADKLYRINVVRKNEKGGRKSKKRKSIKKLRKKRNARKKTKCKKLKQY
jgi:hypothetical protein